MRALIVHAHPEPGSFVSAMKSAAVATLTESGYDVGISDLYAMNFDPVASAADFGDRADPDYLVYALEQRQGFKSGTLREDIQDEAVKLLAADLLVLTFPIFWFSTPAILKGWIDRVLLSGPVYGGRRIYDHGGLGGKRALVGAALGGREHMFGATGIHGELTDMLRHLLQGTLAYVGLDVVEPYFAHHVPYLEQSDRSAILEGWIDHVAKVDRLPIRWRPSLSDFDETFRPLGA